MMMAEERRGDTEVVSGAPVVVTITFTVGGDEVELDATIVRASARTVLVELASGAAALALAMTPMCELVVRVRDLAVLAQARPGRRVGDVPASRQVELVVFDEALDPRRLVR